MTTRKSWSFLSLLLPVLFCLVATLTIPETTFAHSKIDKVKQGDSPGGADGNPEDWEAPQVSTGEEDREAVKKRPDVFQTQPTTGNNPDTFPVGWYSSRYFWFHSPLMQRVLVAWNWWN